MGYIGPSPNPGQNREVDDISSSFNGSLADFTLQVNSQNVSPGSSNAIIVSLGGVVQNPGTDYTVAASTLTFTTAPASGLAFFGLVLGQQVDTADANFNNPVITGDLSIEDKIVHSGDTNTAIRFPAADTITAETAGSERVRIMSDGRVGVGTSPDSGIQLHVQKSGEANMILEGDVNGQGGFFMMKNNSDNANTTMSIQNLDAGGQGTSEITFQNVNNANNEGLMMFKTRPSGGSMTEAMRVDSSARVLIGLTSTSQTHPLQIGSDGNAQAIAVIGRSSDDIGEISYYENDKTTKLGEIQFRQTECNFRSRTGDINFATGGTTERMRINSSGRVLVGTTSPVANGVFEVVGNIGFNDCLVGYRRTNDDTSNRAFTRFQSSDGTQIGFIGMGSSSITFNTSSDYRMKENVVAISDGITRLKTLKPSRFNFLSDTSTTLDGFLAHEVSSIVPEAITGEKDAVDSDDKPIYQGIDLSKIVPLLTAALQEAITKIETLETKVAALEAA